MSGAAYNTVLPASPLFPIAANPTLSSANIGQLMQFRSTSLVNTESLLFVASSSTTINIGNVFQPQPGTQFWTAFWFKLNSLPSVTTNNMSLVSLYDGIGTSFLEFWIFSPDTIHNVPILNWMTPGGQLEISWPSANLITGIWYSLIVTSDGTAVNTAAWLDASPLTNNIIANTASGVCNYEGQNTYIGSFNAASTYFDGKMNNVAFGSGYKLTQTDATNIYNFGTPDTLMNVVGVTDWFQLINVNSGDTTTTFFNSIGATNGTGINFVSGDFTSDVPLSPPIAEQYGVPTGIFPTFEVSSQSTRNGLGYTPTLSPNEMVLIQGTLGAHFPFPTSGGLYSFTASNGSLTPANNISFGGFGGNGPAAGFNHCGVFSSDNRFFYIATQDSNVRVYSVGLDGTIALIQTLATAFGGITDVEIHPSGKWLYVSETGTAVIEGFSINSSTGLLTSFGNVSTGFVNNPIYMTFDSTGDYIYSTNSGDGTIAMFSINQTSGALTSLGSNLLLSAGAQPHLAILQTLSGVDYLYVTSFLDGVIVPSVYVLQKNPSTGILTIASSTPVSDGNQGGEWVSFTPNQAYCFNPNQNAGNIDVFSVDSSTGALTPVVGSPFSFSQPIDGCIAVTVAPNGNYLTAPSLNYTACQIIGIGGGGVLTLLATDDPMTSSSGRPTVIDSSSDSLYHSLASGPPTLVGYSTVGASTNKPLGRLSGLKNGIAYIENSTIQKFIAAENIASDVPVAGAVNGQVKNKGSLDIQLGTSIASAIAGNPILVKVLL